MVSTREILYVLLVSLAAGGGYGMDSEGMASGAGAYLPLLLLLLFSTDSPCAAGDGCGGKCNGASTCGACGVGCPGVANGRVCPGLR